MIEGFKIDVPSSEVRARLEAQATEHQEKANRYLVQVEALSPADQNPTYQTNDPRQALLAKHTEHSNKAALFRFMADHVVPAVTYRLSESDLIRLGVIDRW